MAPDELEEAFDPEEADRQILAFIATADVEEGPPTAERAAAVLAVLQRAWAEVAHELEGASNNAIVATMLFLSRNMRESDPSSDLHWCLSAASTIVSGQIPNARQ